MTWFDASRAVRDAARMTRAAPGKPLSLRAEGSDEELTTQLAPRAGLPTPSSIAWRAVVIEGPDAGKTFAIDEVFTRRILFGTSATCDVCLTDRTVSRRHAAIEANGPETRLVDLGSRNGSWVGSVRVRDAHVEHGAIVRLGDTTLRLETDGVSHAVPASADPRFHRVVGISPEMRALYPFFARVAGTDVPALIEGETGTGKEVLAESIHEASARRGGPFVILDCTTVAPTLIEAELFGHERGAFTGADSARAGLFEEAHGGTLFVDEIGDLDVTLQAKLLRAIEKKEVRRVGGNQWRRFDVRVLSATRRDLDKEIQARRFRDDLYYRLAVVRLELPPLRKRQGDIAFLTHYFWRRMGGAPDALSPDVVQRFESYDWPGNVRELYHAVMRQLAVGDFDPQEHVRQLAGAGTGSGDSFLDDVIRTGEELPRARQRVVDEFERRYVTHMLAAHGGNVTRAAAASGIGRRYFQMVRAKR